MEAFNWNDYEDIEQADVPIKAGGPNGPPTGMVITLAGPEHDVRKKIAHARQRRVRAQLSKTGKIPVTDPQEDEVEQLELLVASTLGWSGAAVEFSPAAARALYSDPKRRWLRDQVQEALDERELFTRRCAAN